MNGDTVEAYIKQQKIQLAIKIRDNLRILRRQGCKHAEQNIDIMTQNYDFISIRCRICNKVSA